LFIGITLFLPYFFVYYTIKKRKMQHLSIKMKLKKLEKYCEM